MSIRIKRRYFEAPMCDEIDLSARAQKYLTEVSSPPTAAEILNLSQRISTDLATRVFYEGVASFHGEFIRKLSGFPRDTPSNPHGDVLVLVLPGMFYKEHPEVGADGHLVVEIAHRFGFDAEQLELHSTGSVTANSRILHERLERVTQDAVWLFALSKGTSDALHCLQRFPFNPRVKGLVNVAGIFRGSPLADRKLTTPWKRSVNRMLCKLVGIDFRALSEMSTTHPYWQLNQWPSHLEMIHIAPVPLAAHIQGELRTRHRQLLPWGPNDGFVPITDVLRMPGHILPIWGCDHFLRTPEMSLILYQLLNLIAHQSHNQEWKTT